MAVLLADLSLTVTPKPHVPQWARDSQGFPVAPPEPVATRGPMPGAARRQPDLSWTLRLDPAGWELWPGDRITDGTRVWVVATAELYTVPGFPDADYIGVTATLEPPRVP